MLRKTFLLVPMFLVAMFDADPQGAVVWKNSDLKNFDQTLAAKLDDRKAAVEEFRKAGDYQVAILHREGDGGVEVETSDVLLIIESGQATLLTGKIVDAKVSAPKAAGGSSVSLIDAGESKPVAEGDVVLIPANLPHRVLVAAGKRVTYLAIRPHDAPSFAAAAPALSGKTPPLGVDLGSGFRSCVPGDNSPDGTVVNGYRKMMSRSFLGPSCLWKPETPPETVTTGSTVNKKTARPGADVGEGYRGCLPGDTSPSGTIVDGYRKVMTTSPFGVSCGWEKIQ
jgi:mannose-6-phosphate isomerase-like protein (cupin superfamily)